MDILVSEDLQAPAFRRLATRYDLVTDKTLWQEPQRLRVLAVQARALLVRNQTQVTAELLAEANNLVAIGRVGVGLDNIDVARASELGIVVVAPLNANATSVAELTLGLMLALTRKLPQADRSTKAGEWDRKGCTGVELAGKTLGLCGFGRIGSLVARLARSFDMRVVAFDPYLKSESPAFRESGAFLCGSLEQMLTEADFVSVHLPLTAETRHLFNASRFAAFKPGAYFINTSRGGVVDEAALLQVLQSGCLAGAALDVREVEPPKTPGTLATLPNVILTPHVGAFTREAQDRTFEAVASDVERLLSGQPAVNFVNFDRPRRNKG